MKTAKKISASTRALASAEDLSAHGLIETAQLPTIRQTETQFAVRITPQALKTIRRTGDAVYRQYVPHADELATTPQELADPIGDSRHSPVPGIIHRYSDRCLLNAVDVCAVYCRFCFRRENIGGKGGTLSTAQLTQALDYIAAQPNIWEVILSGGDPLMMKPVSLARIMQGLAAIPHVKILRLHTRIPVVDPERIDDRLLQTLKTCGKTVYVALHVNHAQELDTTAERACAKLIDNGIPMLSQSVLLRGINDRAELLAELMRRLVSLRIKPYYIHHPDRAKGTGRFRVDIARGQELMRQLRRLCSGLCQPTYMLEIPGGAGKVPAGVQYVYPDRTGGCKIYDDRGQVHDCPADDKPKNHDDEN